MASVEVIAQETRNSKLETRNSFSILRRCSVSPWLILLCPRLVIRLLLRFGSGPARSTIAPSDSRVQEQGGKSAAQQTRDRHTALGGYRRVDWGFAEVVRLGRIVPWQQDVSRSEITAWLGLVSTGFLSTKFLIAVGMAVPNRPFCASVPNRPVLQFRTALCATVSYSHELPNISRRPFLHRRCHMALKTPAIATRVVALRFACLVQPVDSSITMDCRAGAKLKCCNRCVL
jgi:hypothetical protein